MVKESQALEAVKDYLSQMNSGRLFPKRHYIRKHHLSAPTFDKYLKRHLAKEEKRLDG